MGSPSINRVRWLKGYYKRNIRFRIREFFKRTGRRLRRDGEFAPGSGKILGKYNKILIIRINHSYAGLFAYFIYALNQLRYCEKYNYLPIVNFGEDSTDGKNAYHDSEYGDNIWDYYFEPVAELSYAQLKEMLHDDNCELTGDDVIELSDEYLNYLHMFNPSSIYGYAYGHYKYITRYNAKWFARQRAEARRVVEKYIRVKKHIRTIIDNFEQEHMVGHKVLGIHMRGTDKGAAIASSTTNKIVGPEEYYRKIEDYSKEHSQCKIFVATDQEQYLEAMKERYGDRVIHYDAQRSRDNLNIFQKTDEGSAYKKGEEALVDSLLLSRCDFLLKCTSHLSETSMYFNPTLECIDMNYIDES